MDVRIGITTSFTDGQQRLDLEYVRAVERAGGVPMIVPMVESETTLAPFADLLHGLVITGGPAVTEGLVGELADDISVADPVRLRSDRAILEAFLGARRPILGICYGMQLLNAVHGGTIYGDLQHDVAEALPHSEKRGAERHRIDLEEASFLRHVLQSDTMNVNTRHVQAVASLGRPFRVAARAPDGVVEAIENEDGTVMGVQFHPENMGDVMLPLFRYLVENARGRAVAGNFGT